MGVAAQSIQVGGRHRVKLLAMPFLSDGGGRTVAIPVKTEPADSEVFLLHKVLFSSIWNFF